MGSFWRGAQCNSFAGKEAVSSDDLTIIKGITCKLTIAENHRLPLGIDSPLSPIITESLICSWELSWSPVGHRTKFWPMGYKQKWYYFWFVPLKGRGRPSLSSSTVWLPVTLVWGWAILDTVGPRIVELHYRSHLDRELWAATPVLDCFLPDSWERKNHRLCLNHYYFTSLSKQSRLYPKSVTLDFSRIESVLAESTASLLQFMCFNR